MKKNMRTPWHKDFVHNTLVHPFIPFLALIHYDWAWKLHDLNARWAYGPKGEKK